MRKKDQLKKKAKGAFTGFRKDYWLVAKKDFKNTWFLFKRDLNRNWRLRTGKKDSESDTPVKEDAAWVDDFIKACPQRLEKMIYEVEKEQYFREKIALERLVVSDDKIISEKAKSALSVSQKAEQENDERQWLADEMAYLEKRTKIYLDKLKDPDFTSKTFVAFKRRLEQIKNADHDFSALAQRLLSQLENNKSISLEQHQEDIVWVDDFIKTCPRRVKKMIYEVEKEQYFREKILLEDLLMSDDEMIKEKVEKALAISQKAEKEDNEQLWLGEEIIYLERRAKIYANRLQDPNFVSQQFAAFKRRLERIKDKGYDLSPLAQKLLSGDFEKKEVAKAGKQSDKKVLKSYEKAKEQAKEKLAQSTTKIKKSGQRSKKGAGSLTKKG